MEENDATKSEGDNFKAFLDAILADLNKSLDRWVAGPFFVHGSGYWSLGYDSAKLAKAAVNGNMN